MGWKTHHIKMSVLFQLDIDVWQNCFKISARFFIDINKIILKFMTSGESEELEYF